MRIIVFKNLVMLWILLSIGYASEVSAQCYRGDQELMNNTGNRQPGSNFCAQGNTQCNQPIDPNEIVGLDGYDAVGSTDTLRWVSATQTLAYTVYFENDPDLATATASKVTSTLPLHEKLN